MMLCLPLLTLILIKFQSMKILGGFIMIKKKMPYYSPSFYKNVGSNIILRPRERALLILPSNSIYNSATYKVKFSNRYFFKKIHPYHFSICIQNISKKRRIIIRPGCILSSILKHKYIKHYYSAISIRHCNEVRCFHSKR
jgi:hypothetical protein